jgi:16S rRNA (cytidine1402-2'-O)-methyltransferase
MNEEFRNFVKILLMANLYLIPTTLGDQKIEYVLPGNNSLIVKNIRYFIVEDLRTARRYLKKIDPNINIDEIHFSELNEHTDKNELEELLSPLKHGHDVGIISEAGCPGIADPGADIVSLAHERKIRVIPLVGPSSVLLSLMASGMNGQNFAFIGYLPIKKSERIKSIRDIEKRSAIEKQTQIFIETPYRNTILLEELVNTLNDQTKLCIAVDLTLESESICTQTIASWKKKLPTINKRPAIFLIHKD